MSQKKCPECSCGKSSKKNRVFKKVAPKFVLDEKAIVKLEKSMKVNEELEKSFKKI